MNDRLAAADLHAPVIDAVLAAAIRTLGVEAVYIDDMVDDSCGLRRVDGSIPGLAEGQPVPRQRSICHRMLGGAPNPTRDARAQAEYRDCVLVEDFGVTSYIGVPIRHDDDVIATLCGIDRAAVALDHEAVTSMSGLAGVVEAHLAESDGAGPVLRRRDDGWRVGRVADLDLTSAMSLADLIADEIAAPSRPQRSDAGSMSEVDRLRLSVVQLEHALVARVIVEQAIGVLAERQRTTPRAAFERLRKAARTRGRKVHEVAHEVVASAHDASVPLPPELAGPR